MNTSAVASQLGTNPKTLRRFLRSEQSTFVAVGSGARYDFTSADVAAMRPRFAAWSGRPAPATTVITTPAVVRDDQAARDRAVWEEEGPVVIPDIRKPAVLRAVRKRAREQEARLNELLLAAGLHITQRAS